MVGDRLTESLYDIHIGLGGSTILEAATPDPCPNPSPGPSPSPSPSPNPNPSRNPSPSPSPNQAGDHALGGGGLTKLLPAKAIMAAHPRTVRETEEVGDSHPGPNRR